MGLISSLVCERALPLPFSDFGEDEEKDFKEEFFVFNDRSLRYKVSLDSD